MQGFANRLRRFSEDTDGGFASLEFVLVSIPGILIAMCVVQFMMMAHASIVMKNAAHAAARSALVHYCPPVDLAGAVENLFGVVGNLFNTCTDDREKVLNAARIALIPISASNDKSRNRQGSCDFPESLSKIIKGSMHNSTNMTRAFENKACYAFEPDNVDVKVEWDGAWNGLTLGKKLPPVTVKIKFRLPIIAPVRMIFSNGTRGDGTRYWEGESEVTLL